MGGRQPACGRPTSSAMRLPVELRRAVPDGATEVSSGSTPSIGVNGSAPAAPIRAGESAAAE